MKLYQELTIGHVSGLIALGNSIVALAISLLLAVILVRHYNSTLSAATWSVITRQLHTSPWPSFLRVDSVATKHVHWSVSSIAYLNTFLAILSLISGVVTPLGLGNGIRPQKRDHVPFDYMPDLSTFGKNTQARSDMPLGRDCIITAAFCPGTTVSGSVINQGGFNVSANASITATTRIPDNITAFFTSATQEHTIASILDIQYRSWMPDTSEYFDEGRPYQKGLYRHMDVLIPRDTIVLVEGIIADLESGGVGFRNHTAPIGLNDGARWEEDVLWVEPEISCANTNLSLGFTLKDIHDTDPLQTLEVLDQGGFANLRRGNPYEGWPDIEYASPNVSLRADRSAWLNNFLAALVLNLTDDGESAKSAKYGFNVSLDANYTLDLNNSDTIKMVPFGVKTGFLDGSWLAPSNSITTNLNGSLVADGRILDPPDEYPYEFATALFDELGGRCNGQITDTSMEVDHNVECGYFFGAPLRIDRGNPRLQETGSKWRSDIYTCAGVVKASIKTISFSANGSGSLDFLAAQSVKDKVYSTEANYPLWAVENWWYPGSEGAYAAPLWGVVDASLENTPGYNFTRAPSFYLPYTHSILTWEGTRAPLDMLAGSVAPYGILAEVLTTAFDDTRLSNSVLPRYGASDNLILQSKWESLSQSTEGAETLLRLVWTDMMASSTVGTNSRARLDAKSLSALSQKGEVTAFVQRITYDFLYAIPAIMLLGVMTVLCISGLWLGASRRPLLTHLKEMLNDTSIGRLAANMAHHGGEKDLRMSTNDWLEVTGHVQLQLGKRAGDQETRCVSPWKDVHDKQLQNEQLLTCSHD